jgi:hypothetical protein
MAEINCVIILYSKYSSNSKKLLNVISEYSLPQFLSIPFREYCIDNKEVRKMVTESKKLTVSFVPVILLFYVNGYVEKYEGEKAFEWVGEIVNKIQFLQKQNQAQNVSEEVIENEENEEIEEIEEDEIKTIKKVNSKNKSKNKGENKPSKSLKGKTNISTLLDLDSEDEGEREEESDPFELERMKDAEEVKKDTIKKDSGIMAKAMEMQKMRDSVVEK